MTCDLVYDLGQISGVLCVHWFPQLIRWTAMGIDLVEIVWLLDLQLPMQSVPITIKVVSSNLTQMQCTLYNIVIKSVSDLQQAVRLAYPFLLKIVRCLKKNNKFR